MSETPTDGRGTGGRRVFLLVAGFIVTSAGVIGSFVGANSAERGAEVVVLGAVTLPTTPAAVALYAAFLAAVVLALLFGAVEAASRVEEA